MEATNPPFNVAIVGGGAVGLAVLLRLVEKDIASMRIALIERQSTVGPGLAYSAACEGTRINMHSKSMSLYVSDQDHFDRWMRDSPSIPGGEQYPPREYYGKYLKDVLGSVTQSAAEKGIDVVFLTSTEVLDIEQHSTQSWRLHLSNDAVIEAKDVSLCLGNEMAQQYKYLEGTPFYFGNPWPNKKFLSIPKTASVAILGSRLTAIDEALYLTDRGYTGQIYFLSRSGTLPKVQAAGAKKPERAYSIWNLARELEKNPVGAIITIMSRLHAEMVQHNGGKSVFGAYAPDQDVLSVFRNDVQMARDGNVPGQAILQQTGPLLERYWACLSEKEQQVFCKEYLTVLTAHRNAMPLRTGERLLKIMESGQLKVLPIDTESPITHSDGVFSIPVASSEKTVYSDALIESTGIEGNPTRIRAPLMQNLLARKIVRPHAAGGVDCDHQTLKVSEGLYVIGSMTRGVHFYSTSIDRNVRQAERIADNILGIPLRRPLHVALFAGNDLYSQLQVSRIVRKLMAQGQLPFIFLAASKAIDEEQSFERQELEFYENHLLQSTVVPQLGISTDVEQEMTVRQLVQRYPIYSQNVENVNDPSFIHALASNHIDVGFCFRSSHSFATDTTKYFEDRQGLFNLAPGFNTSSAQAHPSFGYTLREISSDPEHSTLVDIEHASLDRSKALFNAIADVWPVGAEMVSRFVDNTARSLPRSVFTPEQEAGTIFTDPTPLERDGVPLVDRDSIQQVFTSSFGSASTRAGLQEAIDLACRAWYKSHQDFQQENSPMLSASRSSFETLVDEESSSPGRSLSAAVSVVSLDLTKEKSRANVQIMLESGPRRRSVRKSMTMQVRHWANSLINAGGQ